MTGISRRPELRVIAAWALASAIGAAATAALSLGTLAYLLVASPIGHPLLWGVLGLAHWVAVRQLRVHAPAFGRGVVIGLLGGMSLALTIIPFIPSLNLPALLVIVTTIAGSGLGMGEGIALTEGLTCRGFLVFLHVGGSGIGAAAGAALAIWVGVSALDTDPSTLGLVLTTAAAGVVGATAYGLASGWTVAVLVRARRQG